jgi:hypothetical protein
MDCGDDAHYHISKEHGDIFNRDLAIFNERERTIKGLIETAKDLSKNSETEKLIEPLFDKFKLKLNDYKITKEFLFSRMKAKGINKETRQEDIRIFAEKQQQARKAKLKGRG